LLRILRFDMGHWPVIEPRRAGDGVQVYETPAREFEVSRIPVGEPDVEREAWSQGPQTLLFLSEAPAAKLRVASDAAAVELTAGAACLLADDTRYRFSAPVSGEVIKVSVPVADAAPATFRGRSPVRLAFGTSGLRGLVTEITDLEGARSNQLTGFGLVGHASGVARESRVSLEIRVADLPLLPGALELAKDFQAGGLRANRAAFEPKVSDARGMDERLRALLYDPQTSGGLLLLLPQQAVAGLLGELPAARLIGRAVDPTGSAIHLV
jgi:hypothetical protein